MAEPLSPNHSSPSLFDTEGSSQGVHLELRQSLEDQGLELGIVLSIQPFSSRLPPSDSWSPQEYDLDSSDNPIQTPKSPQNPESP